ncbi:MAG: DNA polymerase III subunit alpha [Defluviitaleaceae bacterium]|nr:DNA polymerase III subunit alpha [Defluviitaleaceae bacterium]
MFVHLHTHSEFSLLDGSAKLTELVACAKAMGMDSLALTDHGVMYGAIDFYKLASANGIKPIIGCEVYVAYDSRHLKEKGNTYAYSHLVLLAENMAGYKNLLKLVSIGFTEGFYYKPRVDTECLRELSEGLIALSACASGVVSKPVLQSSYSAALQQALFYDGLFGRGNFFLELQDHGLADQQTINSALMRISNETGIPLVATNDVHYITKSDSAAHDILLCIQTGKTLSDDDRLKYESDQFYFKTQNEMLSLFPYAREAVDNTVKIAERCSVKIDFKSYKLPKYPLPNGADSAEFLRGLCAKGLTDRYGSGAEKYGGRLEYELNTIIDMGFADYFLIVWDFIEYAKKKDIIVGPGRGTICGSIAAYCLGISTIDPMEYGLVFERFLNPERISMPDIDTDFCYERRQEVIDYVIEKYGSERVAQIITFGTMAARAVIRDVGRALGMPYADADRVAKMIPFELGITLNRALEINPELKKAYNEEDDTHYLIDMAIKLEGLPRHASTHAAGVVICNAPVSDYVPLNVNDGVITTQFPMNTIEELGLLKMDFLGLRTLTVIQKAIHEIERGTGKKIDINKINYSDPKIYDLISAAKTEGVFQLEGGGMKSFMKELQPQTLADILAGIALYRPGPMASIPRYIAGKNDSSTVRYTHAALEPILKDTYGCVVYQEQVMQIVRDLAGYSLSRSDLVRRAMSKKKASVMAEERKNFIYGIEGGTAEDGTAIKPVPGCIKNGIPEQTAGRIFDEISDFANYGFNKSHAAGYAVIIFQTAWLKVYYPVEFMAATMTSVMYFSGKVAEYIHECKKMGVRLLPPDINEGYGSFSVSGGCIRFGLNAIKNVGRAAVDAIVGERKADGQYKSMKDFIKRLDSTDVNKRCMESLIKAGAFDSLGGKRSQYMSAYRIVMDGMSSMKKNTLDGQINLFELSGDNMDVMDELPQIGEFAHRQMLNDEKEVLGVYVSGHPLSAYIETLLKYTNTNSLNFMHNPDAVERQPTDGQTVCYGGMITSKTIKYTRSNGDPMAFIDVEDLYGTVEVIVFSNLYKIKGGRLNTDQVLAVKGRASVKEDEDTKIIASEIYFYEDMADSKRSSSPETLWIKIADGVSTETELLTDILMRYKGGTKVIIYNEKTKKRFTLNEAFWVTPGDELRTDLEEVLGEGTVKLTVKAGA